MRKIKRVVVVFLACEVSDLLLTIYILNAGGVELNPLYHLVTPLCALFAKIGGTICLALCLQFKRSYWFDYLVPAAVAWTIPFNIYNILAGSF